MLSIEFQSLIILLVILSLVIGVLLARNYYLKCKVYSVSHKLEYFCNFLDKLLDNISIKEGIDVRKYLELTSKEFNNEQEGGE